MHPHSHTLTCTYTHSIKKDVEKKRILKKKSQAGWHTPVVPALGRWKKQKQEEYKFKARLGYGVKPCVKNLKGAGE